MERIDRNEYIRIPQKSTQARPTQFWLERVKTPVIHVYPTPEEFNRQTHLLCLEKNRRFYASVNDVDIPSRFMPCLTSGLAYYLCFKKEHTKAPLIKQQYEQDLQMP